MLCGKNQILAKLLALVTATALLAGCGAQALALGPRPAEEVQPVNASDPDASLAASGQPQASFKLATSYADGRLVYTGVGGEIDGQVNPDLAVDPGDLVQIVLVNGDGRQAHNLAIGELGLTSGTVYNKDQETRLVFRAGQAGVYPYFSTFFGEREAGLEGRLVIGSAPAGGAPAAASAASAGEQAMAGHSQAADSDTVSYKLVTGMAEGKMVFIGSGGEIDGQVNPDLIAQPGQTVEILLANGDGILHNVALDGYGLTSEDISQQGQETRLTVQADQEGEFAYYCAIPGHRQAGMEGRLIVGQPAAAAPSLPSAALAPDSLPGPLQRSATERVRVDLETVEVEARLADGSSYTFWTFNGTVPGPFIRVRVGDTVEVHLKNAAGSTMAHSVDFHAATGPGGGAVATQTKPGEETMVTFKALNPGLYVYHCATPMVAHHIANGMYGLILVEPEGGLPPVDREFYVMQGEIYTAEAMGQKGALTFSQEKLLDEDPEYFVFNGAVGALTAEHPLQANTGETVRIFFGVGGPNITSSFHVIGEIFDRVYDQGSLTAPPLTDVQTTLVPTGGAVMVEFTLEVPGRFILVDHSLSRMERGLAGFLVVEGPENKEIFDGVPTAGSGH